MTWRPADSALLRRLRDEVLFSELLGAFGVSAQSASYPKGGAAMVDALRDHAPEAVEAAALGNRVPLLDVVDSAAQPPPALAHHLALLHRFLAEAHRRRLPAERERALRHGLRSLEMWCWLLEERSYLLDVVRGPASGGLDEQTAQTKASEGGPAEASLSEVSPSDVNASQENPTEQNIWATAREAVLQEIDDLQQEARAGVGSLCAASSLALWTLQRSGEALARAGVRGALAQEVEGRAVRACASTIDLALGRISQKLADAAAKDADEEAQAALFAEAASVWRWSNRSPQAERYIVEKVTPTLWAAYRARRFDTLQRLLEPVAESTASLTRRVLRDPNELAYAAPCAQVLVFRAEVANSARAKMELVERALSVCPSHRNARLVLSDILVNRALDSLRWGWPFARTRQKARAAADLRRAEQLFPMLKRLPAARQRLLEAGVDLSEEAAEE